jgi:hypothetical protein
MHRAFRRTETRLMACALALVLGLPALPAAAQQGNRAGAQPPHVAGSRLAESTASLRGRKAIGNIPGLSPLAFGRTGEQVEFIFDEQSYRLRMRTVQENYWGQLSFQNQTNRRGEPSDILGASFGAHLDLGSNHVLGAVALIDRLDQEAGRGGSEGLGWLAGLYVAGRHPGPNLRYDLAVLAGQGTSTLDPVGTYSDSVTADRLLVTGDLSREFGRGPLRITPSLNLKYSREDWPAYTDGRGHRFEAETYEFVETRARLRADYALGPGSRSPRIDGSLSLTGLEDLSPTEASSRYGAVEVGFTLPASDTTTVRITMKRDRIGEDMQSTDNLQFRLILRF